MVHHIESDPLWLSGLSQQKVVWTSALWCFRPRHCIARLDVFEFPSVVVKPESILLPGNVFFIVPNHTLYNLLKTKGQTNNLPFIQKQYSPNDRLVSSYAWVSSKLQTYKQHINCLFTRKGKVGKCNWKLFRIYVFSFKNLRFWDSCCIAT